jgi:hypothetical protein
MLIYGPRVYDLTTPQLWTQLSSFTSRIDHRLQAPPREDLVKCLVIHRTPGRVTVMMEQLRAKATFSWRREVQAWVLVGERTPCTSWYARIDELNVIPIHHLCLE